MKYLHRLTTRLAATILFAALLTAAPFHAAFAAIAPSLGTADSFAVLGGSAVSNTGSSVITGDLGIAPGLAAAVTGFPPGLVTGGTIHAGAVIPDPLAAGAELAVTTAYNDLFVQPCDFDLTGQDLGGQTLVPGVYCFSSSAQLTGALTLNAGGNTNAVWVFKMGSTLTTAVGSSVLLTNDGQSCNVFWQVGSSATIGTTTTFIGNILALTSITLNNGANMSGRALARNGAVTLDTNTVAISVCGVTSGPIPPTLGKAFSPATINAGGVSTLTITLSNADTTAASLTAPFIDTLPSGMVIALTPGAGTTCGGTLTANASDSTVTLTGGSIPANGSCTVSVNVTAPLGGSYINSLIAGALQSSNGSNAAPAVATLIVNTPAGGAPTVGKAFSPATIYAGGFSTLTITLSNPASTAAIVTRLTDTMPSGMVVASTPSTNCGGTLTVGASTVTLTGGSIPANGSCTVTVPVTAPVAGSYFNSIAIGENVAVATLTVLPITVSTPGLTLSKTPNPTTYTYAGQVIVYTYVLKNTGDVTLTGPFTVTDNKLGSFTCGSAASLAPGASITCTQNYTIQASDLSIVTSLPTGVTATINTGAWLQGTTSTQDTMITGAGPGVLDDIYPAWCIQDGVPDDLHNQPATLYSTIGGSLPADVAGLSWNQVNYVLNHKIRGAGTTNLQFFKDVQTAIWELLGESSEFGVNATAQQMIDEANAHSSFVPGPCDVVAVIIYSDGMHIFPGSIQESICEMKQFGTIVNYATGSGTFGGVVVQSGQVQATVKQTRVDCPTGNSAPKLKKSFSPATIYAGGVSTLTITLSNPNSTVANLTAPLTDYLPSGMVISGSPNAGTTCSGSGGVSAYAGGTKVTLPATRSIPANGSCTVTVKVTAKYKGSYYNKLPVGALQTNKGSNVTAASATLTVTGYSW